MPIYTYKCINCLKEIEVLHSFEETYEFNCSICNHKLEKIISSFMIIKKDYEIEKSKQNIEKAIQESKEDLKEFSKDLKNQLFLCYL